MLVCVRVKDEAYYSFTLCVCGSIIGAVYMLGSMYWLEKKQLL